MKKKLTKEQIAILKKRLFAEIWPIFKNEAHRHNEITLIISVTEQGYVEVEVSRMYEHLPLSFEHLEKLAAVFGTRDFKVNNWSVSGCETCDYGSSHTHSFSYTIDLSEYETSNTGADRKG